MTKFAIIGTAGRDKTKPMTRKTWDWMLRTAMEHIPPNSHLVSGGAAWSDHIAVALFLMDYASEITLHLPAPLDGSGFVGPYKSAASATNYYHRMFSQIIGANSIGELIYTCEHPKSHGSFQPPGDGFSAFFTCNRLVVQELNPETDHMVAFTFGQGDQPADGGTRHTWDLFRSTNKKHFTIPTSF